MHISKTDKRWIPVLAAIPLAFQGAAQEAEEAENALIEIIEVTAQKRVTSLQETPIAISAFNEDSLEEKNIEDALDIQFNVPNMIISGNSGYNIRGVGNNAISSSSDPGTGVHLNGVYMTSNTIQNEFYDLQAVEVLRGPQGTLYGRNTTAGVVNAITRRPGEEFEFNLAVEVAEYDSLRTTGALNFAISENILQRFAFNTVKRDGYSENIAESVDFDDLDGRDQYSLRSSTAFSFGEDTDGLLFIQTFKEDSNRMVRAGIRCTADEVLGCSPGGAGFEYPNSDFTDGSLAAALGLGGLTRSNYYNTNRDGSIRQNPMDPYQIRTNVDPLFEVEETLISFEINHDFGEHILTSITAYHDKETFSKQDFDNADGTDAFVVPVSYYIGENEQLVNTLDYSTTRIDDFEAEQTSQEIRLASYLPGDYNYTVGAFWLNYKSATQVDFYVPELGIFASAIGVPDHLQAFSFQTPDFETTSWAVFGEFYYDMSDKLKLTAGLRYTEEEKDIITRQISPLSFLNPAFDLSQFSTGEGAWEEFTGKLGFSYEADLDATDETLFFGTISRGYKGGGINPAAGTSSFPTFDPEYINAFEVGTKNTLLEGRMQFNATVFIYDYKGYQVGGILPDGGTFNTNVDADVSGAEFEIIAAPVEGLKINLNYSLLDTEIIEDFLTSPDISQPTGAGPVNIKGNELTFAPGSSLLLGLTYTHALTDDWEITYQAQTYWQDEFYTRLYNLPTDLLDSWQQTNASIVLQDSDDIWQVELFVKNLNDKASYTASGVQNSLVGRYRTPAVLEPRLFGLRVSYRYY